MQSLKQLCIQSATQRCLDMRILPTPLIKECMPNGYVIEEKALCVMPNRYADDAIINYINAYIESMLEWERDVGYEETVVMRPLSNRLFNVFGNYIYYPYGYNNAIIKISSSPRVLHIETDKSGSDDRTLYIEIGEYIYDFYHQVGEGTIKIPRDEIEVILNHETLDCEYYDYGEPESFPILGVRRMDRSPCDIMRYLGVENPERCLMVLYDGESEIDNPSGIVYITSRDVYELHDTRTGDIYYLDSVFQTYGIKKTLDDAMLRCTRGAELSARCVGNTYKRFIEHLRI